MLLGFRAGPDPQIGVASDDFAGTRRALGLPDGTAQLGRVFPDGARVNAATTPAQLVAKMGKAAAPVLAAGMWPYLSFKPEVAPTLAGALDAHFAAVGHWAASLGVPVYMSIWHEAENDVMGAATTDYRNRARNFNAVHARAYRRMKPEGGDALKIGPCYLIHKWALGTPETENGLAWRIPDDVRDFTAADCYTSNWSWSSGATLRAKKDFQRWMTILRVPPAELILAERGISRNHAIGVPGGEQAQSAILQADITYLTEMGAHGLIYWNSGGSTDDSVYLLAPDSRPVFVQAAIAAARTEPAKPDPAEISPAAEPPTDRYAEGYVAGRRSLANEMGRWLDGHAG